MRDDNLADDPMSSNPICVIMITDGDDYDNNIDDNDNKNGENDNNDDDNDNSANAMICHCIQEIILLYFLSQNMKDDFSGACSEWQRR